MKKQVLIGTLLALLTLSIDSHAMDDMNVNHSTNIGHATITTLLLAGQIHTLIQLKKNNQLFGANIITERMMLASYLSAITPIFRFMGDSSVCHTPTLKLSLLLMSIVLLINKSYDRCLKAMPHSITLQSHKTLDPLLIANQTCPICIDTPNNDALNLCKIKEHIYCRSCITSWFETKKDNSYTCLLCMQKINLDYVTVTRKTPSIKDTLLHIVNPAKDNTIVILLLYYVLIINFAQACL